MLIGSHVSMSGKKKCCKGSAEEAHKYGGSTFMIYTGAPQNTRRKNIEDLNIEKGQQAMKTYGLSNIVVHAPYIINIANTTKPEVFNLEVFLQRNRKNSSARSERYCTASWAHVGAGVDKGIQKLLKDLMKYSMIRIALETMAGKGTEVGRSFEEIAQIIDGVTHNDRLSVCFDTCHTHDAGYNVKDFDGVLEKFDSIVE